MAEKKDEEKNVVEENIEKTEGADIDLDRLYGKMDDDWTGRIDSLLDRRLAAKDAKPVAESAPGE